jgi:two-component system, cell cycle sensor histidine kinase and response regulator CckA
MGPGAEQRSRLLAELASALTVAATDLDQVMETAARAAAQLIGDGSVVRLTNDQGVFDHAAVHHPDPVLANTLRKVLPEAGQRDDEGFAAQVRAAATVVIRNDLSESMMQSISGPLWRYLKQLNFGAIMTVPLIVDDTYLGTMSCGRAGRDRPFTDADARLAEDVAARVALAAATARTVSQLRTERQNYAQIVETCAEGVWKIDTTGRTTFVNTRMADILSVTATHLLDTPATTWQSDPAAPPWWRLPVGHPHELQLRHGDGHLLWTQVSVSTLTPGGVTTGQETQWLAMVTDISDRVRSRELADRVAQLQRLDSIGQLAGGIAHDFNNLLSIIGGGAELMLSEVPPGSPAATLARQITSAVEKGAALTRQLLSFGRGRPGTAETIDVNEEITELAPMLQRTLGEHIQLRFPLREPGQRPCHVRINQGHLHQVIVNLASNARDAMNAGGRLSIDCEHTLLDPAELGDTDPGNLNPGHHHDDDPGKAWFVRIAVSDTGTGMDPATLRHAFEPFYTTKPPGHGTGLGLAGVYGIIRTAGGLVRLYSEPNHGTTVKIYLPAADEPISDQPDHEQAPSTSIPGHAASAEVLVVEDNPALAEVIKRLLHPAGYTVTVALTPGAALDIIDRSTIVNLVVTDVVMPELTGPELATRIHELRPGLPIIYTSGYTPDVLGERAHLPPDAILVEKPFTRTSLINAVVRALDR